MSTGFNNHHVAQQDCASKFPKGTKVYHRDAKPGLNGKPPVGEVIHSTSSKVRVWWENGKKEDISSGNAVWVLREVDW